MDKLVQYKKSLKEIYKFLSLNPPDMQRLFEKRINATTVTVNASHASFVSHPEETAELILNATKVAVDEWLW